MQMLTFEEVDESMMGASAVVLTIHSCPGEAVQFCRPSSWPVAGTVAGLHTVAGGGVGGVGGGGGVGGLGGGGGVGGEGGFGGGVGGAGGVAGNGLSRSHCSAGTVAHTDQNRDSGQLLAVVRS